MADMDDEPTQRVSECSGAGASAMESGDDRQESDNQEGAQSSGPVDVDGEVLGQISQANLRLETPDTNNVNNQPISGCGDSDDGNNKDDGFKAPELPSPSLQSKSMSPSSKTSEKASHSIPCAVDPACPYTEPTWAGIPEHKYTMEILKNGKIIDNIDLNTKSFHVFGRLKSCDVSMEHPSMSRFHAVLQYCASKTENRDIGWYMYDLDSTHGTWINKHKVNGKIYYRIRVGHVIKFGGSTRLHILQGPPDDEEPESDLSLSELKAKREEKVKAAQLDRLAEKHEGQEEEGNTECSWGMGEDATEVETPFQMSELTQHEHLYVDDPKKALKNFFEREGWDLPDYQLFDAGFGKHKCVIELPVDTPSGEPLCAEVTVSGKRKEAVLACALEACRTLDRMGELSKAHQESRKKKSKNWEDNDFYDSDDDEFLDRTGMIEQKRVLRMEKAGKLEKPVETYETLSKKLLAVQTDLHGVEKQLEAARSGPTQEPGEIDALDAYMSAIKSGAMDTKTRLQLKRRMFELRKEEQKLQRLVNIARPAIMPVGKKFTSKNSPAALPMIGKIKGRSKPLLKTIPMRTLKPADINTGSQDRKEVEEDEDEDEDEKKEDVTPARECMKLEVESAKNEGSRKARPDGSDSDDKKNIKCRSDSNLQAESIPHSTSDDLKPEKKEGISCPNDAHDTRLPVLDSKSGATELSLQDDVSGARLASKPEKPAQEHKAATKKRPVNSMADTLRKLKKPRGPQAQKDYDANDPDFAVWMPPVDQTGDGRTHLNDKFGY